MFASVEWLWRLSHWDYIYFILVGLRTNHAWNGHLRAYLQACWKHVKTRVAFSLISLLPIWSGAGMLQDMAAISGQKSSKEDTLQREWFSSPKMNRSLELGEVESTFCVYPGYRYRIFSTVFSIVYVFNRTW